MVTLLSQRNFFLLWIAHTISILGDYVFFIAITFWIYQQTNSASATGLVLITSTVPMILFAPLAGILVDRRNRRDIMLVAESARAVLFLGLLGSIAIQPHTLWPIYVVGFIQSALATFFWSARGALLSQLIEPALLLVSNALYTACDSVVRIIAPSLSALSLLHLGPAGIVAIDAITFILSAACTRLLTIAPAQQLVTTPLPAKTQLSITSVSAEENQPPSDIPDILPLKKLWMSANTRYYISGLLALASIIAYTTGTLNILLPIFVRTILSAGPLAFGWMLTAQATGEGIMSLLLGRLLAQRSTLVIVSFVSACSAGGGLTLMLIVNIHTLLPNLLLNLIFGAMAGAMTIQLLTFLQQRVTDQFLGRTLATYAAIQTLAQVSGMVVASTFAAHTGVSWLMMLDGALYLLGSGLAWTLLKETSNPK
jgi:DHA3 family macrolide efflux protein-like MFS transporter